MSTELRHLRYFVAVAEAGQVALAARRLFLTQPAVSKAVRELEREVGCALFERHPAGMRLTAAGAALLADARAVLELVGKGRAGPMTVELRHLRALVAVAETGAIGRAARALETSSSALSVTLRDLEEHIGSPLLVRGTRGAALTTAGRQTAARAQEALDAFDRAMDDARRRASRPAGVVRLGILPYALTAASALLAAMRHEHPEVDLHIRQLDFRGHLHDLRAGRLDAELLVWEPDDPGLEVVRIGTYETYVQIAATHPLAGRATLRFEDIAHLPWPGRHPDVPEEFTAHFMMNRRRGGPPPVTPEQPVGPDELWPLVAAGRAITTIPAYLRPMSVGLAGVCTILLEDAEPSVMALARRRGDPDPIVQALFAVARRLTSAA